MRLDDLTIEERLRLYDEVDEFREREKARRIENGDWPLFSLKTSKWIARWVFGVVFVWSGGASIVRSLWFGEAIGVWRDYPTFISMRLLDVGYPIIFGIPIFWIVSKLTPIKIKERFMRDFHNR